MNPITNLTITNLLQGSDTFLKQELKNLNPEQLSQTINLLFTDLIQKNTSKNPKAFLDRLTQAIPFSQLQEAVKTDIPNALEQAKGMLEQANLYLELTQTSTPFKLKELLSSILTTILSIIESIVVGIGIGDFFKPAESATQADFKSNKLMILLSLFTMLASVVLPIIGAATGGLIIGGIFLVIIILSVLWPYIKPITNHLPYAENITEKVKKRPVVEGRRACQDETADILKTGRHAIFVGESRIGKTATAEAFAKAVENGQYKELKGMKFFKINVADLINHGHSFMGGGDTVLRDIADAMGRHKNRIVLILDEIHMACKGENKLADQLKPFLDENGAFPHVIGISTKEEYEEHVKHNVAFSRRFDPIEITNTAEDETLQILHHTALANQCILENDAIEHLYQSTKNGPQPNSSLKTLKYCITKTRSSQKSKAEKELLETSNKIAALRARTTANRGHESQNDRVTLLQLKGQVVTLEKTITAEKARISNLFACKKLLDKTTKAMYLSAKKAAKIGDHTLSSREQKQINQFVLLHQFLVPLLETHIKTTAKELNLHMVIDQALIDEVLKENL